MSSNPRPSPHQGVKTEDRYLFHLLSSSVPLEYTLAKHLVKRGFSTSADYQCERAPDFERDWSVDLHALSFPFQSTLSLNAEFELLIECKYRRPGSTWLFFPDPNRPDFSPFTFGSTFQELDQLSMYRIDRQKRDFLENHYPLCYKGVEIRPDGADMGNAKRKTVDDVELKHGLLQLQWAVPKLVESHISSALHSLSFGHCDEVLGLFFTCILVTTADIRVAKTDFDTQKLLTDGLATQSTSVPAVVIRLDTTRSLRDHWVARFAGLTEKFKDQLEILSRCRAAFLKEPDYASPQRLLRDCASGGASSSLSGQMLVCTAASFASIVDYLLSSTKTSMRARKKLSRKQIAALCSDLAQ